jgi:ribosomal protein S12 methylthiotransferase accessory factor
MVANLSSATSTKVFFHGTHRVRPPEETWERVLPKLTRFGITRVADVTGLDTIGIPVAMAVRPLAKTLSVSQGKGQSLLLAKVSAAMEAIELWHAEYVSLPTLRRNVPGEQLNLSYGVRDLAEVAGSLVTDVTPLDWVRGTGLVTQRTVPVPRSVVSLVGPDEKTWMPAGFVWSSNGLASGNSVEEAALHALYEIVERDAVAALPPQEFGVAIDAREIAECDGAALVEMIRQSGASLAVYHVPSRIGVPCYSVRLWSADFPITSIGFGAHLDSGVALSRAITEAAQSRLTVIAGSRDDIPALYDLVRDGAGRLPDAPGPRMAWADLPAPPVAPFNDVAAEIAWVAAAIAASVGHEPILMDLSSTEDLAVVKAVVPGMAMGLTRYRHA